MSTMALPLRSNPFIFSGLTAQLLAQGMHNRSAMHSISNLFAAECLVEVTGPTNIRVRGLCTDSRRVTPGALFFALPGRRTRGTDYVEEAAQRGAVGIVCEEDIWVPRNVTLVQVRNVREALAEAARRFHDHPERSLELIGIAGTSGKTVVATLLRQLLEADRTAPSGLLGTIHYHLGPRTLPSYRTTPEPVDLYSMLAQMRDHGCQRCILEISSHGIDQERVANLDFGLAAFLNLSEQHLEYHGSMEAYFATVQRFFDGGNGPVPRTVVVNADDPWTPRLLEVLPKRVSVVSFGLAEGADVRAEQVACGAEGSRFTLRTKDGTWDVRTPLLGRFNISNTLAALALGANLGLSLDSMVAHLAQVEGVRGRMEAIEEGQPFSVVVDYMHTPEAYRGGLATLREITEGKLIVVFGCGGNRDPKARPAITRAVLDQADYAIATADNPRSEQLEDIFSDMRAAVRVGDPVIFLENRRQAISEALDLAQPGDLVLIAGKGHETYQEFTDTVMPFDDRAVARELLRKKRRFESEGC